MALSCASLPQKITARGSFSVGSILLCSASDRYLRHAVQLSEQLVLTEKCVWCRRRSKMRPFNQIG